MNYAVIGTGEVGRTIATKLVELGHAVTLGSRTPDNEAAVQWAEGAGGGASHGTFADAATLITGDAIWMDPRSCARSPLWLP